MTEPKVVCPDCHLKFPLPPAVTENIRAGVDSLRPKNNVVSLKRGLAKGDVAVTLHIDRDELHELVGQANEVGATVEEYLEGLIQNLT